MFGPLALKAALRCRRLWRWDTLPASCGRLPRMRRRHFLVLSAASVGGVIVYSLDRKVSRLSAEDRAAQDKSPVAKADKSGKVAAAKTVRIPLRSFTESAAANVAAAVARIFPSDDAGPGAHEAGVVIFIDRQLADPWGRDARRYP